MLTDRIAYTCSRCSHATYAPSGNAAVTCSHCGIIDLGTELARQRWRTVAEIHLANRPPDAPVMQSRAGYLAVACVMVAALVLAVVALIAGCAP